ncbi:MAG TPA: amidohydrolase [Candidatus Dormibacteraeota bacterium]|nr:amidohydrolase [Candidatus Dormibacteraeota bacterium]
MLVSRSNPPVSLAVLSGVIWRPGEAGATALAVAGDRIVAVGTDHEIRTLINGSTRVFEARGGTIMPAFNDAHVHFLMASRSLDQLDLFGAETQTEVERRTMEFAARGDDRGWVLGRGWFYSAFPGGMPSLELLDRLVPDRPAYLESFDAHTAWVNSRALAMTGAEPDRASDAPAGILKEAAMLGVQRKLPRRTTDQDLDALRAGLRLAASRGIASVQEAGDGLDQLKLYDSLRESDELSLRVRLAFDMVPGLDARSWARRLDLYEEAARGRPANDWISTGILKAFADGVLESRTASLLAPYAGMKEGDTGALGAPLWGTNELAEAVRMADSRGWQVQVHAIGDAAIRQALDAFEGTTAGRRHRVEHIEAPAAEDIGRFAKLGVIASMQPQHAEPGANLLEVWAANLGAARSARGWPWASILHAGGRLAFGTDWPVVPLDPALSLHVAVNRQTRAGDPPAGWLPEQKLSLEQAVAGWTSGSAYAEHAEHARGALREGMLADIAVLDRDLSTLPVAEIATVQVRATAVGGRLVHERS